MNPIQGNSGASSVDCTSDAEVSSKSQSTDSLLPEPMGFSGDPLMMLAQEMIKIRTGQRQLADQQQAAAAKAEEAAGEAKIQALRDKADEVKTEGLVSGLTEIGGGALTIGGAYFDTAGELDAAKADALRGPGGVVPTADREAFLAFHKSAASMKFDGAAFKGVSAGATGGGKIAAGEIKGSEVERDADAAKADSDSRAADARSQAASRWSNEIQDDIRSIREWVKQMIDSKNQGLMAAIRRG